MNTQKRHFCVLLGNCWNEILRLCCSWVRAWRSQRFTTLKSRKRSMPSGSHHAAKGRCNWRLQGKFAESQQLKLPPISQNDSPVFNKSSLYMHHCTRTESGILWMKTINYYLTTYSRRFPVSPTVVTRTALTSGCRCHSQLPNPNTCFQQGSGITPAVEQTQQSWSLP